METFGLVQIQNAHTYYFVPDNFKYFTECAGLKNIDFGESQITHMYGIFKVENITPDLNDLLLSKEKMFRVLKHTRRKEIVKWLLNLLGLSFIISFIVRFKRKIMWCCNETVIKMTLCVGKGLDNSNPNFFIPVFAMDYRGRWWRRGGILVFKMFPLFVSRNPLQLLTKPQFFSPRK